MSAKRRLDSPLLVSHKKRETEKKKKKKKKKTSTSLTHLSLNAFTVFSLLSTFSAARFITRYRNDGVMVEPLVGFFGGLYIARRIKITSPVILRSGIVTGGSPFLIPILFGSLGAFFGYWFVHGTGYVIGDPNDRVKLPDPREHDYVFGPVETTYRFARWEQLRAEAAPQSVSYLPRAASYSSATKDKWD
jgi:hypothetical protein